MFEIRESKISGNGVFTTEDIPSNSIVGIWCTKDISQGIRYLYNEGMECKWYETAIFGRYCNHSFTPNTTVQVNDDNITLLSNGILANEEITVDYRWATEHINFIVDVSDMI